MIKSLKVEGLNHRVNADLEFNEDLNIITGKNGSGKTTLLKLLWYLISGNLKRIIPEIPFESTFHSKPTRFAVDISPGKSWRDYPNFKAFAKEQGFDRNPELLNNWMTRWRELSERIAQTTKRSLFFPTFRRIEGGFPVLALPFRNQRCSTGEDVDHSDRSTQCRRFPDEISV